MILFTEHKNVKEGLYIMLTSSKSVFKHSVKVWDRSLSISVIYILI